MKPLKLVPANDSFRALQLAMDVVEGKSAGFITPPEVLGVMPEVHGLPAEVDDHIGFIVESSGSTGTPKRISLSTKALLASASASANRIGSGQWLLALPTNFIAGINVLVRSVVADTQPILLNTQVPFTAEAFIRGSALMGENRYTSLVPYQLRKLLEAAREDAFVFSELRKFKTILVGGQQPNWADVLELRTMGVNVVVSYGMTETCGGCVYDSVPLDGVGVRIADDLIAISGPTLAENLGEEFLTNDIGVLTDGKLEVLGRADRVIVSGGLKISLDRVEEAALALDGVIEVCAVAINSEWGQSVGLAYVGAERDFSELSELSPAARPRLTLQLAEIPKLSSGKPDLVAVANLLAS
jgi:O-succinylbenzoic acid--CoA ligase